MVGSSGGEYATTMILNNDVPHQPMNFAHMPHHEGYIVSCSQFCFQFFFSLIFFFSTCETGFFDIPTEESVYVPSHGDLIGAPLVNSFESDEVAAETDIMNIISLDSEEEDEEYKEDENVDEEDDSVDELPPRKRRSQIY